MGFVITVSRFFGSGLRNDSDMEENYTFTTHIHFKCSDIGGCTLYLSQRSQVRPSKMASFITADHIRRDI